MKINKKTIILILTIILIAGGIFVYSKPKAQVDTSVKKINPKKTKTYTVKRDNLEKYLTFAGKVDAEKVAVLAFQTSGQLQFVNVKLGDYVKKGQLIAGLNKEDLQKKFQKYLNDYMTDRWNFEDTQDEYKTTKEKFLITTEIQRILDREQYTLNNSVLDVEIANIALKYANLYTPIEGIVVAIDQPNPGINITPTGANFTIVDPTSIFFKSEVDEEDVAKLNLDLPVKITLDTYPDNEIDSKLYFISFTPIEGESSTIYRTKFTLNLNNDKFEYRIGMNGDANVKIAEAKNVLKIPIEALFEDKNGQYVLIKDEKNQPKKINVKTGVQNDDFVEITEGISEGETIIYE